MLAINPKTITISVVLLLIIGTSVFYGTNSIAQKKIFTTSDNIVLVKKIVYNEPEKAADFISEWQKYCTKLKEDSYASTKLPFLAPLPEDSTNIEEIKKFQNATVTEYFRGTSYAKYSVGQEWLHAESQSKIKNPDEFDCALKINKFVKGEIRTPTQKIEFSKYNDEQGKVEIVNYPIGIYDRIQIPKLPPNLEIIKVGNANTECYTNKEAGKCYFKDLSVHGGTKKLVILQTNLLEKGINPMNDSILYGDPFLVKFASKPNVHIRDVSKIEKFESIEVGKEISEKIFDMSMFKGFKIINKN
jgi:hypothetical protein